VDHLWGPLGTVLVHAALILLLVRWVVLPAVTPPTPVEVAVEREERIRLDPFLNVGELRMRRDGLEAPPFLEGPETTATAPDVGPRLAPPDPSPQVVIRDGRLWREPAWMRARMPEEREARLARYAPEWARRTEPALDAALGWLRHARQPDGGWAEANAAEDDPALTALATLVFLARGEPLTTVQPSVSNLMERQQSDGTIPAGSDLDAQGVAACALIETWVRVPIPPLRRAAELAVERLLREQEPTGLWVGADAWSLSWRTLALRTAAWTGLEVPGLRPGLSRLVGGLKTVEDPAGGLFQGDRPSMSDVERVAAVALALQWLGEERSPEARQLLSALHPLRPHDAPTPWALHLLGQIRFNDGGNIWERDRAAIAETWLAGQQADGGWRAGESGDGGRVRATALAGLSLTVCYRYPPASEWPLWRTVSQRLPTVTDAPALAALSWAPFR